MDVLILTMGTFSKIVTDRGQVTLLQQVCAILLGVCCHGYNSSPAATYLLSFVTLFLSFADSVEANQSSWVPNAPHLLAAQLSNRCLPALEHRGNHTLCILLARQPF